MAMLWSLSRLTSLVAIVFICLLLGTRLLNAESYSAANFEDKLGIAYEFKIHIDAGREDCFYQYIQQGSSLYVAFQVGLLSDNCHSLKST